MEKGYTFKTRNKNTINLGKKGERSGKGERRGGGGAKEIGTTTSRLGEKRKGMQEMGRVTREKGGRAPNEIAVNRPDNKALLEQKEKKKKKRKKKKRHKGKNNFRREQRVGKRVRGEHNNWTRKRKQYSQAEKKKKLRREKWFN